MEKHARPATPDRWKTDRVVLGALRPAESGPVVHAPLRCCLVRLFGRAPPAACGRAGTTAPTYRPGFGPGQPDRPGGLLEQARARARPRLAGPHPSLRSRGAGRSTSAAAVAPFIATSSPSGATRGRHQRASRSSGATARAVTTSNVRSGPAPRPGPRTHLDLVLQPERGDGLVEEPAFDAAAARPG